MQLNPEDFPDLESVTVTITEDHPDGARVVHTFTALAAVPTHLPPSFPIPAATADPVALAG